MSAGTPEGHQRERALALAAAAGVLGDCWALRGGALEWRWLLARLDQLGMAATFWSEATRACLAGDLPGPIAAHLRTRAEENAAQNAQLGAVVLRSGEALDAAGIQWMPIKGAALALVAPEYGTARHISDADLLVRPADLTRAANALSAALRLVGDHRTYTGTLSADAATIAGVHHVYAFRAESGVYVELHHQLPHVSSSKLNAGVWSRAASVKRNDARIQVPSLDDLLGTACVHALIHHANDRRVLLRHLADVRELVARGASFRAARSTYDGLRRSSVETSVRYLSEAREYARSPKPACAASRALEPPTPSNPLAPRRRSARYMPRVLRNLRAGGLHALVPPRSFMRENYGRGGRTEPLVFLHLRRWGTVLLRLIKGGP